MLAVNKSKKVNKATHRTPDERFVKLHFKVLLEKAGIATRVSCQFLKHKSEHCEHELLCASTAKTLMDN